MIVPEFEKRPYESCFLAANFANVMDTSVETIVLGSSSVVALDSAGDVDNTVLNIGTLAIEDITKLKVRILAGVEALSPYSYIFKIITSQNNKWEKDIQMSVEDLK